MLFRWVCAVVVMVVGGLIGYVALQVKVANTLAVRALAALACPGCGKVFGLAAVEKHRLDASAATQLVLADARARGVTLRLDGRWRFACSCGKRLLFDPKARTLGPDETLSPASTGIP